MRFLVDNVARLCQVVLSTSWLKLDSLLGCSSEVYQWVERGMEDMYSNRVVTQLLNNYKDNIYL